MRDPALNGRHSMDEQQVREQADAFCSAIVAGDIERATEHLSNELRQHLGEVLMLLPLPSTEAAVESLERAGGGSAYAVVLRLIGESNEVMIQTRWKDRDGRPTIVEASHLSRTELAPPEEEALGTEGSPEGDSGS
jgi:hypothetical protein